MATVWNEEFGHPITTSRRRWRKPPGCTPYVAAGDQLRRLALARQDAAFSAVYRPSYDGYRAHVMRPVRLPGGAS
jgi:hypothetical protein